MLKKNEKKDHLKEWRRCAASTCNDGEEVRGQTEDNRNEEAEFASQTMGTLQQIGTPQK